MTRRGRLKEQTREEEAEAKRERDGENKGRRKRCVDIMRKEAVRLNERLRREKKREGKTVDIARCRESSANSPERCELFDTGRSEKFKIHNPRSTEHTVRILEIFRPRIIVAYLFFNANSTIIRMRTDNTTSTLTTRRKQSRLQDGGSTTQQRLQRTR